MSVRESSTEAFTFRAFESLVRQMEANGLFFDDFIDQGNFIFMILDANLRIMKLNQRAATMLEIMKDEAVGCRLDSLDSKQVHFVDFGSKLIEAVSFKDSSASINFECRFERNQEVLHYSFELQYIHEDLTSKQYLLLVGSDVTPVRKLIEEKGLREKAELQQTILDNKFKMTANIQKMLLPKFEAYKQNYPKIRVIYRPSEYCSGDFWYYKEYKNKRLLILCDVQGHGVPSGMLGSFINGFIQCRFSDDKDLDDECIEDLSAKIVELTGKEYLTTFSALEIRSESLKFWNAGGIFPNVVNQSGEVQTLSMRSSLLGFDVLEVSKMTLDSNTVSRVIWHTDGFGDFRKNEERFRSKFIRGIINNISTMTIDQAEATIKQNLQTISETYSMEDDVTFVIIDL